MLYDPSGELNVSNFDLCEGAPVRTLLSTKSRLLSVQTMSGLAITGCSPRDPHSARIASAALFDVRSLFVRNQGGKLEQDGPCVHGRGGHARRGTFSQRRWRWK